MVRTAIITIWGEVVGAIAWDENTQLGSFEYDPAFKTKSINLAPLKIPITSGKQIFSFPELRNIQTFNGLPGLLADSLPDKYGNELIDTWLADKEEL